VSKALDGLRQICVLLICSIDIISNSRCQTHISATARLAQSVECKDFNLVVVGSSTTVYVFQGGGCLVTAMG
jgi:hypothetical protein